MVGNLGMVAGLAMGGLLAEPVKTMPGFFGAEGVLNRSGSEEGVKWMVKYPFALPAVVNAVLLGLMAMAAAAWLRETMSGQDQVESGTGYSTRRPYILLNDTENLLSDRHQEKPPAKTSLRSALTTRTLPSLISSFLLALHTSAFAFILPLHLSTPSSPYSPLLSYSSHSLVPILFRFSGGLALSPVTISLYLSLFGLLGLLFRAFVYHWWQNRLSTMGLFELSLAVFPFVYLLTPYLSLFSWGHQDTDRTTGCAIMMKWIALGIVVGGQTLATSMVGPSAKVLLAESAPSEGVRERVQEVGNMVATLASVVGPVVGGVVYAKGVREEVVGAAWWFYLVVVAVVAAAWCVGVQGRVNEESETDEIDVSDFGYVKTSDRGW
ncbi:hypothetical protein QBC32DRAFT_346967 [Pseudoneurospora amorphoporcata]|uniref:Uncharacterized protein n=1 Tax=Pseudoneurospora amorphoporcata TaxID=241081 RepID=A0AAN6NQL9_9PEZI|nr:hypothetical protein QBC32DRAFT_346967 [Pseudoneurospora amorphoporcata]